jgi:hypothetical protein
MPSLQCSRDQKEVALLATGIFCRFMMRNGSVRNVVLLHLAHPIKPPVVASNTLFLILGAPHWRVVGV